MIAPTRRRASSSSASATTRRAARWSPKSPAAITRTAMSTPRSSTACPTPRACRPITSPRSAPATNARPASSRPKSPRSSSNSAAGRLLLDRLQVIDELEDTRTHDRLPTVRSVFEADLRLVAVAPDRHLAAAMRPGRAPVDRLHDLQERECALILLRELRELGRPDLQ